MLNFPSIEEQILKYWQDNEIFKKTLEKDSPKGDFVFYDGPPFATGLPHYGHIVASLMKDMIPRFWTMKGYHVDRKWGWDCHGLPIENIVEQELGLKQKKDIEILGVAKFNELCETKVLKYAIEWRKVIERMGRWVDMDNDYKTMDKNFMESVWWVFKQLWDKGLIYQSYRSIHICPRCETTLSQSEVGQGYKDIIDISATVKFELVDELNTFVLAWTTTPWTLPANVALAVGEDIDYLVVEYNDKSAGVIKDREFNQGKYAKGYYIFAKGVAEKFNDLIIFSQPQEIIEKFQNSKISFEDVINAIKIIKGSDLIGKAYKPLFNYYDNEKLENRENAFKIYAADFVSTEEGTGVVHIAPAFGEDDFNLSKKENLPIIQHVGMNGRFKEEVADFKGMEVKPKDNPSAADVKVVNYLENKDLLFASEKYLHSYPYCWRCDSPLINYATTSWFVAVEKIKKDLLKKAKKINWMPEHIKDGRFGKWLEGARDWSVSRQRYWGSVLPIWVCDKCDAKKVFGSIAELEEASGREVDNLHKQVVDEIEMPCQCGGNFKRVPDVLDCWFESGSMPYAQLHYPFENKEKFEKNFPAQFIAEGADQTRAWFYYLHVLSVAVKGNEAFNNVIVNGIVLAQDGKKMSKKLRNYPDPSEIFEKYGADAMRYYLAVSPVMKADDLCFVERDVESVVKKVLLILANVVSFYKMYEQAEIKTDNSSKNILDKWILAKTAQLNLDITKAYEAYDLNKAARPLAEFINDLSTWYLRRSRDRFKGDDEQDKKAALTTLRYVLRQLSLLMAPVMPFTADWLYKEIGGKLESVHLEAWPVAGKVDERVLEGMETVRKIVELALAKRDEAGIKVRQVLAKLTVLGAELSKDFSALIEDEVNIKKVVYNKADNLTVELDAVLTDALKQEGMYRELVRTINNLRKEAGLTIQDKVAIYYETSSSAVKEAIAQFYEDLLKNTLSLEIKEGLQADALIEKEAEVNGEKIKIVLLK